MNEPSNTLLKLAANLWSEAAERESFVKALLEPANFAQALIWLKERPSSNAFQLEPALSFQPDFVDRVSVSERPGASPLHEQGYFYCLDLSSVFAASALLAIKDRVNAALDMCASPGGKAVFAWRALSPELLICNEVIGKRHAALISNLERLGLKSTIVAGQDSKYWSEYFSSCFDLVICDVPCSGQSLLARGLKSPACFHPATINLNSNRQKRIVANSAKTIAPDGYLAYMTCTYSRDENEAVIEWLLKRFPEFKVLEVPKLSEFQSSYADFPAYRLWPQSGLGAGAFVCLLQKSSEGEKFEPDLSILRKIWPRSKNNSAG